MPNSGSADVSVPDIQQQNTLEQAVTVVVVQVSLSSASISPANLEQREINSELLASLSRHALKTVVNSPVRFLNKIESQTVQRSLCSEWSGLQSIPTLENILTQLAHCPLTLENVRIPNQGFKEERISSMIPITGTIRDFTDTLIDDTYQQYFHPDTTTCFRQRIAARYVIIICFYCLCDCHTIFLCRSSQQCCYGSDGMLVTGSPGGGRATIASPDVNIHDHLQDDVIPYLLCCKAGQSSNCAEYYSKRPSDRGTHHGPAPFFKTRDKRNTMVGPGPAPTTAAPTTQPPNCGRCCCGGMTGPGGGGSSIFPIIAIIPVIAIFSLFFLFGDPHITTHDGYQYTFNGRGEYVLIDMSEDIFSLQGRMAQINNTLGDASRGTVYKALVGKQIFSDTVQFEIIGNSTVIVLVNGEQIDFDKLREQEFSNVTVSYLGNNSFLGIILVRCLFGSKRGEWTLRMH